AGLDSLFVGDHHSTPGPYYQNVPILGRLLAEWGEAPAGCLFLLPLWNPVLVAEQVGTLAAVTRGRFIFQCGLGYDEAQFAAMGGTRPRASSSAPRPTGRRPGPSRSAATSTSATRPPTPTRRRRRSWPPGIAASRPRPSSRARSSRSSSDSPSSRRSATPT